jgi:hypothetical protein
MTRIKKQQSLSLCILFVLSHLLIPFFLLSFSF